jgi:hypothetical protein
VKERNRLATEKIERNRLEAGYGDVENEERDKTVQETMKAVLDTLSERHQAYTEAFELAKQDPNIDLLRTDGPQFVQPTYVRTNVINSSVSLTSFVGCIRARNRRTTSQGGVIAVRRLGLQTAIEAHKARRRERWFRPWLGHSCAPVGAYSPYSISRSVQSEAQYQGRQSRHRYLYITMHEQLLCALAQ